MSTPSVPFNLFSMTDRNPGDYVHEGLWLRHEVDRTGLGIAEFARRAGINRQNLYRLFELQRLDAKVPTLARIVKALGYDPEAIAGQVPSDEASFLRAYGYRNTLMGTLMSPLRRPKVPPLRVPGLPKEVFSSPSWDSNVEPYSERRVTPVPTFELSVAAGAWTELEAYGELREPKAIDAGWFRVSVRGDSMTPDFPDRCMVEFKVLRQSGDSMQVGKSYYVQKRDGEATFKVLREIRDESLVLAAKNRRKYPKDFEVDRSEIVRMAVAIAKVEVVN